MRGDQLLVSFRQLYGKNTRQIGPHFCIPAALSNALKTLGEYSYTQERIRDIYYKKKARCLEPNIHEQMTGVCFDVIDAVAEDEGFSKNFDVEKHYDSNDGDIFDQSKAENALSFVRNSIDNGWPTIVSTWRIPWDSGILTPQCCHMWLALAYDNKSLIGVMHDSGNDQLLQIPFYLFVPLIMNGERRDLDIGLRGRITHTDYACCAIKRR